MAVGVDTRTQLFGKPYGAKGLPVVAQAGQSLGPGPTSSMAIALDAMIEMAELVGDNDARESYATQAMMSRQAADALLWNETAQVYANSLNAMDDVASFDIALVSLAKVGSDERRAKFWKAIEKMRYPAGYANATSFVNNTPIVINGFTNSFILMALAESNQTELAQKLLDDHWTPQARLDANYTGGYWEYTVTCRVRHWRSPRPELTAGMIHSRPTARSQVSASSALNRTTGPDTPPPSCPTTRSVSATPREVSVHSLLPLCQASKSTGSKVASQLLKAASRPLGATARTGSS